MYCDHGLKMSLKNVITQLLGKYKKWVSLTDRKSYYRFVAILNDVFVRENILFVCIRENEIQRRPDPETSPSVSGSGLPIVAQLEASAPLAPTVSSE
jgi:hypothetical protein